MVNNITYKNLRTYSYKFNRQKTNKVLKNVNTKSHFRNLILKSDYQQNKKQVFKKVINVDAAITDQKNSGRCWLFAFLNIIGVLLLHILYLYHFNIIISLTIYLRCVLECLFDDFDDFDDLFERLV